MTDSQPIFDTNRKILDGFIGVLPPWNGTYSRDEQ
jgi:hypothetical protein